MERKSEYFAYRYFVIEVDLKQISILNLLAEKKELFQEIFTNLKEKKRREVLTKNRKFLLYYTRDIDNYIYITKFAMETHHKRYVEGEDDIQVEDEKDFPFIYVIINLKNQVLLIQKKTTLFSSPFTAKNILEDFFSNILRENHYTFKIDEIVYEEKFWEFVNKAEKIYSLELNLKSPNLFQGRYKAEEFLKEQREIYNNTELDIELKNDEGKLKLLKENLQDFIHYIAAGGGKYALRIFQDGIIQRILSRINIRKFFLKDLKDEEDGEIKSVFDEIDRMDES